MPQIWAPDVANEQGVAREDRNWVGIRDPVVDDERNGFDCVPRRFENLHPH
jgi:hypothetical protein